MISARISGIEKISKLKSHMTNKEMEAEALKIQVVTALTAAIKQNLQVTLGDKMKHFDVSVQTSELGMSISVYIIDAVGGYIYYGTRAHQIVSSEAMPVGDGRFAMSVSHPGTQGMSEEIDEAVRAAILTVKALIT